MRFATIVLRAAGAWGIVVLLPLYFMFDEPGAHSAAVLSYPFSYFGFLSVALAWQVAFLVMASDPARFRPLMIPAMLEKFGHVATGTVLYAQSRIGAAEWRTVAPDLVLGILFVLAYRRTADARLVSDRK
jgi:hypothetical protein